MLTATTAHTSLERKILNLLRRWGRGCVFSNSDFFSLAADNHVACVLHHLKNKGVIRALLRGVYDYPKYSKLLQENLAPNLHRVARVLARKHRWHIQASGNAALNYWGWSTQVPTRLLCYSSGPSRSYIVYERTIEFKHVSGKESFLGNEQCELFIQAIKELGDASLEESYLPKIVAAITPDLRKSVEKAMPLLTEKHRTLIRNLFSHLNNG